MNNSLNLETNTLGICFMLLKKKKLGEGIAVWLKLTL